jgi:hypothetical protein
MVTDGESALSCARRRPDTALVPDLEGRGSTGGRDQLRLAAQGRRPALVAHRGASQRSWRAVRRTAIGPRVVVPGRLRPRGLLGTAGFPHRPIWPYGLDLHPPGPVTRPGQELLEPVARSRAPARGDLRLAAGVEHAPAWAGVRRRMVHRPCVVVVRPGLRPARRGGDARGDVLRTRCPRAGASASGEAVVATDGTNERASATGAHRIA